ncbi:MAG TPA: hypothetical protein VIQ24_16995 [Pyrinomonadaceae bacterium]
MTTLPPLETDPGSPRRSDTGTDVNSPVEGASVDIELTQFDEVFREEWREIKTRREACRAQEDCQLKYEQGSDALPPNDLVGLALSGGGIRSATFCLGLLQGLNKARLLPVFDYLSTVSGGGYVGGWWSAWLARTDGNAQRGGDKIFPPPERLSPAIYSSHESMSAGRAGEARSMKTMLEAAHIGNVGQERIADLFSAGNDPVHHLRLFGNYMTPRKGALSADTWRAVTTISRNMLLTWLILLPLLVAAIIVGQLYFVLQPYSYDANRANFFFADPEVSPLHALTARLWLVAKPLLGIILWIVALICAWMINSGEAGTPRSRRAGWAGAVVVGIFSTMMCLLLYRYAGKPPLLPYLTDPALIAWLLLGIGLVSYACYLPREQAATGDEDIRRRREVRRNRIGGVHAKLLVLLLAAGFILLFAGFGHELVNYLNSPQGVLKYVAQGGGWAAVLLSIGGSIYTALKTAPSGGHDPREVTKPTLFSRIVFAVTPPLVLVVLAVLASWVVIVLLSHINRQYILSPLTRTGAAHDSSLILLFTATTCAGIVLSLFFALIETRWKCEPEGEAKCRASWWLAGLLGLLSVMTVLPLVNVGAVFSYGRPLWPLDLTYRRLDWLVAIVVLVAHGGASFIILSRLTEDKERRPQLGLPARLGITGLWVFLTWLAFNSLRAVLFTQGSQVSYGTTRVLFGSLIVCFVFALLERLHGKGDNKRALSLLAAVYLASFVLLVFSWVGELNGDESDAYKRLLLGQTVLGLLGTLLTWVVAFGWMADPNALSLHLFYKSRLVRAYLGASNLLRGERLKEVTEAAANDDVPLHALRNCERSAPYHLINTTLNLVGGRDLATAQRSSAYFTLSKHFCGSTRTGYRRTRHYMDGRMTLGTALAVSGAAASPNMGAMTLTSSLAMLMTLLNVRLGFWAPTPNKSDWRAPSARLWPFYVLREFLSQTTDLSAYCYLTDGGHFDNTGLYSLIERGCGYILVADCGADPRPCFQDLGTAIRRCRIDFNTEIKLDISPLERAKEKGSLPEQFVVAGSIRYDKNHLKSLLPERVRDTPEGEKWIAENHEGRIVIFKPALTNVKKETPDVRQYGLENDGFPQQATVDLWYDEAQFESYRRLGQSSAENFFNENRLARARRPDGTHDLDKLFDDLIKPG